MPSGALLRLSSRPSISSST
ncbi:hypothetical protein [Ochrobactrum sp. Q0168]